MSVISLFKSRNKPADRFEQLISPYIDALYHLAFRLSRSSDDAEEIVQLLLTRLYPRLEQLERIESLKPWLLRALYNLYIDSYRARQRQQAVISSGEVPETSPSDGKTPEEETELGIQQSIILSAMMQLSDDQRIVMLLHDAEGYTLFEIEEILDTPIGTLKSRLHRGRNRIKELTEMELSGDAERVTDIEEVMQ